MDTVIGRACVKIPRLPGPRKAIEGKTALEAQRIIDAAKKKSRH